ncbi:hypothetical protein AY601_3524 [Pedobacter cryoconitis]|uniref:JmjC domain-containing protein n=1 Tax=Pedobacter cryoconitis TaxID=188932 RepID=A0A127VGI8_9SPHI|nr:cupin-like domain-containing protein [Pedobacter cryoconitis]AMQ00390.1 hypothetical protein AY601_3524 [Pedobacter cryoconitis]
MQNLIDLLRKTTSVATDDVAQLTKKNFNDNYGYAGKPVNFTNAFQDMPIKIKWTHEYLSKTLVKQEKIENTNDESAPLYISYADYLNISEPHLYFKTSGLLSAEIKEDYHIPEAFNCWYSNTKLGAPKTNLSWIYAGNAGTGSQIHRDIWWSSAWNYLLKGKKLWLIYPAIYSEAIKKNISEYQINPNLEDWSEVINLPYKPLTCIQNAGDMIFVPGDCYHQVINLEWTLSLTENFINETNYDLVRTYFRNSGNRDNLSKIEMIVRKGFEQLEAQK